ncbi:MAG: glycosyltransferase family 39 protein [Candidatus Auribacterota bacterium]|jgi:4-amino-4-deoxy-L-arabinose transferase-like glycosyltransferase|nr:glycosyltransferase family 39 protein [Candidatus Auribacterota bacterium]
MWYIVVVAFLARLVGAGLVSLISRDGIRFIIMAKALADGDMGSFVAEQYHPLYPALIYLFHFFSADWSIVARMVSIMMGALVVIPLFYISENLFNRRVAYIASVIYAFHPYAVRFSADTLSESTYIFFFMCALLAGFKALEQGIKPLTALFAGGLIAGAYLTRPEGLGLAIVTAGAIVLYRNDVTGRWMTAVKLPALALLICGVVLCSFPYTYLLKHETGQWRITTKKAVGDFVPSFIRTQFHSGDIPQSKSDTFYSESEKTDKKTSLPASEVKNDESGKSSVSHSLYTGLNNRLRAAGEVSQTFIETYHPLLFIFFVIGLVFGMRRSGVRQRLLLAMIAVTFLLYGYILYRLALIHYVSKRHLLPLVTLVFPFCAFGVDKLAGTGWAGRFLKGRIKPLYIITALVLLIIAFKTFKPLRADKQFIKDVAGWLVINSELRGVYAVEEPRIAFYARLPFILIPKCPLTNDQLVDFLERKNIDFMVLSKEYADEYLTGLDQLANTGKLKLISIYKHTDTKIGKKYLLYEYVR